MLPWQLFGCGVPETMFYKPYFPFAEVHFCIDLAHIAVILRCGLLVKKRLL